MINFMKLFRDYQWHMKANQAVEVLRLHKDHELRDIGVCRGDIQRMAHRNCPWCDKQLEEKAPEYLTGKNAG